MQKCPPAEACRDAFERMSKATVQMCMQTTGLGFRRDEDADGPAKARSRPALVSMSSDAGYVDPVSKQAYRQQLPSIPPENARTHRPPPKFDMNLRDLFPEGLEGDTSPSQVVPWSIADREQKGFQYQRQGARAVPQNYQQQTQPRIPPQTRQVSSKVKSDLGMAASPTSSASVASTATAQLQPSPSQQQLRPQQVSFYDGPNVNDYNLASMPGLDFLNTGGDNDSALFGADSMDLGPFDLDGLDFTHDWQDGNGFGIDLFDGFF